MQVRSEPYTVRGIKRVPCARCGRKPSYASWYICALGGYSAMCGPCDVLLQILVLKWAKVHPDDRARIIRRYSARVRKNLALGRVSET